MHATTVPPILDQLSVLSDPTRSRLLLLLERGELSVAELCTVLQLPQSTVSRHLKSLADVGWAASRPDGTSRLYRLATAEQSAATLRLWALVREQVAESTMSVHDARRLERVLAERRSRSQEFFNSSAAHWDRVRDELFGQRFHLLGMLSLLDPDWTVGDLGCGAGQVSDALAPNVKKVIAVDGSNAMLQAARRRLKGVDNVELRRGELEALPISAGALDAATLILVLHHLQAPAVVIREAARVLRPRGRLLIVDMVPHDREAYRQEMGHQWLGFADDQIGTWLESAGFEEVRVRVLPAESKASGPPLFAASGRRGAA